MAKFLGILAFFFLFASPVFASDPQIIINPEIYPVATNWGDIFLAKELDVSYESGQVFFQAHPDHATPFRTYVDDGVEITVTKPSGDQNTWYHDYSGNCESKSYIYPVDLTFLFAPGTNKVKITYFDICGGTQYSTSNVLTNLNLVADHQIPQPFLRLPWNYNNLGLTFADAALSIVSYFDHEFPLLSGGVIEPSDAQETVTTYRGEFRAKVNYSSHDGYDYARAAKVLINDPVYAAASGCATYEFSNAGGNTIKIDHGNSFQTRYLHLQPDGLVTTNTTTCVQVSQSQTIGKVGATGNVIPKGDAGAHIHFSVIYDKNHDGNFSDNIPDGVVDPFGWQSSSPDPWENFSFNYLGPRTGAKSSYLWQKALPILSSELTNNGAVLEQNRYQITFPAGSVNATTRVHMQPAGLQKISNVIRTIGSPMKITAKDAAYNLVHTFQTLFTVKINFSDFANDISSKFKTGTLAIFSSDDGVNWTKEQTAIDDANKTATTQINHLSYFTLAGELADTTAPTTTATITATASGTNGWLLSDAATTLSANDNSEGLGVDYTLFQLDDSSWQKYGQQIAVTSDGNHTLRFYSVDKNDNIEALKSQSIKIDRVSPATPSASPASGTYSGNQTITLASTDATSSIATIYYTLDGTSPSSTNGTLYSNPFTLNKTSTIKAVAIDFAGNQSATMSASYTINPASSTSSSGNSSTNSGSTEESNSNNNSVSNSQTSASRSDTTEKTSGTALGAQTENSQTSPRRQDPFFPFIILALGTLVSGSLFIGYLKFK